MAVLPVRPRRPRQLLIPAARFPSSTPERCCAVSDIDFDTMDFFTNPAFVPDPQPFFEHLRCSGPVVKEPHHGVVAVTGYGDTLEVFKDATLWSNCVAVGGPFPPLPFTPEGDDISEQIDCPPHPDAAARAHGGDGSRAGGRQRVVRARPGGRSVRARVRGVLRRNTRRGRRQRD